MDAAAGDDAGDDADGGATQCATVSQTVHNNLQPADIIFAVDTSASMAEELGFVQQNLNAFSEQIIASGVDAHVIMLATAGDPSAAEDTSICTTMPWAPVCWAGLDLAVCVAAPLGSGSCPDDSHLPGYAHVDQAIGSTDVLNLLISAYPTYKPHLRPGALKTFVVISDDDATAGPLNSAASFTTAVAGLEPGDASFWADWKYSANFSPSLCSEAAAVGVVHDALVTQTGGVKGDLCLQDSDPVFDALAAGVIEAAKLTCEWDIPAAPSGKIFQAEDTSVRVTLDGDDALLSRVAGAASCAVDGGWYYDDAGAPTKLLVCAGSCDRMRAAEVAEVEVMFGCDTQ